MQGGNYVARGHACASAAAVGEVAGAPRYCMTMRGADRAGASSFAATFSAIAI
jgi:hypothetical protein